MPVETETYKGLVVLSGTPSGSGGQLVNQAIKDIADRLEIKANLSGDTFTGPVVVQDSITANTIISGIFSSGMIVEFDDLGKMISSGITTQMLTLNGSSPSFQSVSVINDVTASGRSLINASDSIELRDEQGTFGAGQPLEDLVPTPPKPAVEYITEVTEPLWMNPTGTRLFGKYLNALRYSDNDGSTWTYFYGFDRGVQACRMLDNGELLVSLFPEPGVHRGSLWLSDGYPTLGTSATWTRVLEAGSLANVKFGNEWCIDHHENIVVACEYGDHGEATRAYLSQDYGVTWTTIFTLPTPTPNAHLHGIAYDRWWKRIWLCSGDQEHRSIRYSDDLGQTWKILTQGIESLQSYQPVGIRCLPDCILFNSDSPPNGIWRIWRRHKHAPVLEIAYLTDNSSALTVVGSLPYWRGEGYPIFMPFARATVTGPGIIAASMNGERWDTIYTDTQTYPNPQGVLTALGPTSSGNVVCSMIRGGNPVILRFKCPTWIPVKQAKLVPTEQKYLSIGTSGNYAATEGGGTIGTTSGVDLRILAYSNAWTGGGTRIIASKHGAEGNRSWALSILNDGRMYWQRWPLGTDASATGSISTGAIPDLVNSQHKWLRLTHSAGTFGLAEMWHSNDPITTDPDLVTWTKFYEVATGDTSFFTGTAEYAVGALVSGTYTPLSGRVYHFQLRNGVGGTKVIDRSFSTPDWPAGQKSGGVHDVVRRPDSTGIMWRLYGNAEISSELTVAQSQVNALVPALERIIAGQHLGFVAGRAYGNKGSTAGVTLTTVVDRLYAQLFYVPVQSTWDGLCCKIMTSVAGSTVRLGIYAIDQATKTGGSGAPIAQATVSGETTGEKVGSFATVTLPVGWYYIVASTTHALGILAHSGSADNYYLIGHPPLDIPNGYAGFFTASAGSSASLPSSPNFGAAAGGNMPYIAIRKAP